MKRHGNGNGSLTGPPTWGATVKAIWNFFKREPLGCVGVFVAAFLGAMNYSQQERFQRSTDVRFKDEQLQREREHQADKAARQKEREEDKTEREPRIVDNGINP